ncbi:MAG: hypothetical protein Q4C71_00005, partial [Microbacteriaceae bacterium]|nr:hypothetical protein [Microbacteriaceae bacterium]
MEEHDVFNQLHELAHQPYDMARVRATERIVKEITANGPELLLPRALLQLHEAYTFSNNHKLMFPAFARILKLLHEQPELFDEDEKNSVFWQYKWLADAAMGLPDFSRQQCEEFLQEMARHYSDAGYGLCAPRAARFNFLAQIGSKEALPAMREWLSTPLDEFDECPACRIGSQVAFFAERGDWAEAIRVGELQDSGCNVEPAHTHRVLAFAYLMTGDSEAALENFRLSEATVNSDARKMQGGESSSGITYETLGRGGALQTLLQDLSDHDLKRLFDLEDKSLSLLILQRGLIAGLSALIAGGVAADTPTGVTEPAEAATLGSLRSALLECALVRAEEFDKRNQNTHYQDTLAEAAAATPAPAQLRDSDLLEDEEEELAAVAPQLDSAYNERIAADRRERFFTPCAETFERIEKLKMRAAASPSEKRLLDLCAGLEELATEALDAGILSTAGLTYHHLAQMHLALEDTELADDYFEKAMNIMSLQDDALQDRFEVLQNWTDLSRESVLPPESHHKRIFRAALLLFADTLRYLPRPAHSPGLFAERPRSEHDVELFGDKHFNPREISEYLTTWAYLQTSEDPDLLSFSDAVLHEYLEARRQPPVFLSPMTIDLFLMVATSSAMIIGLESQLISDSSFTQLEESDASTLLQLSSYSLEVGARKAAERAGQSFDPHNFVFDSDDEGDFDGFDPSDFDGFDPDNFDFDSIDPNDFNPGGFNPG